MTTRVRLVRENETEEEERRLAWATAARPGLARFTAEVFGDGSGGWRDDLPLLLWEQGGEDLDPAHRDALGRLVKHLDVGAPELLDSGNEYVRGLVRLARMGDGWVRPVGGWQPEGGDAGTAFSALARHLVAVYPVPAFMDSVLLGGYREVRPEWFYHVASGGSLRTAPDLTVPLTRRMAHCAMEAPDGWDFISALRRGQVLGLGGDEALAESVAWTLLGRRIGSGTEEEWRSGFIHWVVNHPELEPIHHGPVADFFDARLREDPGFGLKGRTPASVLDAMRRWHAELARRRKVAAVEPAQPTFRRSGYRGGQWHSGDRGGVTVWSVQELLDPRALEDEGRALHHCVAGYEAWVRGGRSAIWSLRARRPNGFSGPVLTVEVERSTRRVVQARGAANRIPTPDERRILERWARENGLSLLV